MVASNSKGDAALASAPRACASWAESTLALGSPRTCASACWSRAWTWGERRALAPRVRRRLVVVVRAEGQGSC
eukprot:10052535-Alexandrium_andersonii.AAC.1